MAVRALGAGYSSVEPEQSNPPMESFPCDGGLERTRFAFVLLSIMVLLATVRTPMSSVLSWVVNCGMVARWARGKAHITLIVKVDSGLWQPRIPGDALEIIERLAESGDG